MGYYSDVVIQCATKAFGIIKEAYEGVGVKPSKMLVDPCDKSKTIRFDCIKWDAFIYDDIATIEKAILSLNDEKYAGDEDYAYKMVRVGQNDGDTEETYNELGFETFGDLFPVTDIHIPEENFECDENGIPILNDAIESVLNSHDFSVLSISEQNNRYIAELETFSPAGENVICDIHFDGTTDGFISAFEEYADDFDPDEHAEMWIEARGKVNGVPDSIRTLIDDAEAISEMLENTAEALKNLK